MQTFRLPHCGVLALLVLLVLAAALGARAASGPAPTFGSGTSIQASKVSRQFEVGDFNRDAIDDVVSVTLSGSFPLFIGNGMGGFASVTDFPVPNGPNALTVGDLNRDGFLDVATANGGPGDDQPSVSVFLGDGTGNLVAFYEQGLTYFANSIVILDANRDGIPDLATGSEGPAFSVIVENGDGSLGAPLEVNLGTFIQRGATTLDLDRDGFPDLAFTVPSSVNMVFPVRNDRAGGWIPLPPVSVGENSIDLTGGDFNRDGYPDLATSNYSGTISVLLNDRSGGFTRQVPDVAVGAGAGVFSTDAGDLNGDGCLDLVVINSVDRTRSLLQGDGTGAFVRQTPDLNIDSIAVNVQGDFNRDGRPELLISRSNGSVTAFSNSTPPCEGAGFQYPNNFPTIGSGPVALTTGDFDGDGKLDLATANFE